MRIVLSQPVRIGGRRGTPLFRSVLRRGGNKHGCSRLVPVLAVFGAAVLAATALSSAIPNSLAGADIPPTWAAGDAPPNIGLTSLSCASSAFCLAVGEQSSSPTAAVYEAGAWTEEQPPAQLGALSGVSCVSSTFCMVVGGGTTATAATFDGASWSVVSTPAEAGPYTSVSCASLTFCAAVGNESGNSGSFIDQLSGTRFVQAFRPAFSDGILGSVSCPDTTFCQADGAFDSSGITEPEPIRVDFNGSSWNPNTQTNDQAPNSSFALEVSCVSGGTCMAGYGYPPLTESASAGIEETNDGVPSAYFGDTGGVNSVSCLNASTCEAVGPEDNIASFDGTGWTQVSPPQGLTSGNLLSVSCTSDGFCNALGTGPSFITGTPVGPTTATSVTSNQNPSGLGNAVTLTATVDFGTTTATPTGSVDFSDGGASIGTATLDGDNPDQASLSVSDLQLGMSDITATYEGDGAHTASTSGPLTQDVEEPLSGLVLSATNPGTTGPTSYKLTATGLDGQPTGVALIADGQGGDCAAMLTAGVGSCSISEEADHSPYSVSAEYSGDSTYAPQSTTMSEVIDKGTPTVMTSGAPDPSNPGTVTFTTTVSGDGPTPTGTVGVSDGAGGTCTVTLSGGGGNCVITENASPTAYSVSGTYSGDANYASSVGSTTESVNRVTPTVALTATPSSENPAAVSYGLTVTGSGPSATGSAVVNDGRGETCTATISGGSGSCVITESTASDAYQIQANYLGDVNYLAATARIAPTPTVKITPSANPAISGSVTYSVSVIGTGPTPTGTVVVSDGDGGTCTLTLISGSAGCAITEESGHSPYSISASYAGDSYYTTGSGTLIEAVNPAVANVVLTPSSDPASQGPVTYTTVVTGNGSTPTGSVTVSDGQGGSCTATLNSSVANCAVIESGLNSPFTITATYSGDANYSTASASLTNASGVSTSPTGTALATLDGTTTTATGVGTVNILQYQADPVGAPTYSSAGVFFDVAASVGNSFSSEVIQDCSLNGGTSLLWWNPTRTRVREAGSLWLAIPAPATRLAHRPAFPPRSTVQAPRASLS